VGVGQIPTTGLDDALRALRACQAAGLKAVALEHPPAGPGTAPGGDAEEFWELAGDRIVVCLGSGFGLPPAPQQPPAVAAGQPPVVAGFLTRLAFAGIADLVPGLRILVANVDAGWLPYMLESADTNYRRAAASRAVSLGDENALPSEYVRRFTWTTFHQDRFAVVRRSFFGEHHLLWTASLPSYASDWPNDEQQAHQICEGLPEDARDRLLSENCRRLFGIDHAPSFTADEIGAFDRPWDV
jgi:predicted TIM-barrel fold metal-dependent hydrolase